MIVQPTQTTLNKRAGRDPSAASRRCGATSTRQAIGGRASCHNNSAPSASLIAVLVNGRIEAVGPAQAALRAVIDRLEARPETENVNLRIEWAGANSPDGSALPPAYYALMRRTAGSLREPITVRWRGQTLHVPEAEVQARTVWRTWAWVADDGACALVYARDWREARALLREAGYVSGYLADAKPAPQSNPKVRYHGRRAARPEPSTIQQRLALPKHAPARAARRRDARGQGVLFGWGARSNPAGRLRGSVVPARAVRRVGRFGEIEVEAAEALDGNALFVGEDGNVVAVES